MEQLLIATNDVANFTLSDTLFQRTGYGDMDLSGIQVANLNGGPSANAFTVSGWSGTANLDGKGGSNTYNLTLSGSGTGTVNVADSGSTGIDTLNVTALKTTFVTSTSVKVGTQGVNYGTSGIEVLKVLGGKAGLTFDVQSTSSSVNATTVQTYGNSNVINVGSTAGLLPYSAGVVSNIVSALSLVGGGQDTANVDDSGDMSGRTGYLTSTQLTGLGMGNSGVAYSGLAALNLSLGTGGDTINIQSTAGGTPTTIIASTSGSANTINVGSQEPSSGGNLAGIQGLLTVQGGGSDTLNLGDTGNPTAQSATLTATTLTGLDLGSSVLTYGGLNSLNLYIGTGGDTINIQSTALRTTTTIDPPTGSPNTFNVGSLAPIPMDGVVDNILGPLVIVGGADTMNVDDTGSTIAKTGKLTESTLTGLNMAGITYSGLAKLNINLGSGGNQFTIAVSSGAKLPATSTINGGSPNTDSLIASWAGDFNGILNLSRFATTTVTVGNNFNGSMTDTNPGYIASINIGGSLMASGVLHVVSTSDPANPTTPTGLLGDIGTMTVGGSIAGFVQVSGKMTTLDVGPANTPTTGDVNDVSGQVIVGGALTTASVSGNVSGAIKETLTVNSLYIGGSLTQSGLISAVNTVNPALGDINTLTIQGDLAGQLNVLGTLKTLTVHGGTPGTVAAGQIGTIGVYGGYGPVVAQIEENGIQRLIEAAVPSAPFPTPTPGAPTPAVSPTGITFQYFYEGLVSPSVEGLNPSTNLANPQLTAHVTNATGNKGPDQFDFSLITDNDTAKFNLVRLDATGNSGVSGIRNIAVEGDILTKVTPAASTFFAPDSSPAGIYLPQDNLAGVGVRDYVPNHSINAKSIQAVAAGIFAQPNGLLVTGTSANYTNADGLLTPGTAIVTANSTFRVPFATQYPVAFFFGTLSTQTIFGQQDVLFTDEQANSSVTTDPRGGVTALVTIVSSPLGSSPTYRSGITGIAFNGNGGSILTGLTIARSITSTGPLGDIDLTNAAGLTANITAPTIFGNILASTGPISGTIMTTGIETDPITGDTSQIDGSIGRLITTPGQNPTVTEILAGSGALSGQIITPSKLISLVDSAGVLSGTISAQGDIGVEALNRSGVETLYGGILASGGISGQIVTQGNLVGNVTANGGMVAGRIVAEGSILGNVTIESRFDPQSAIISGGAIGNAALGTSLAMTVSGLRGFVAAIGSIIYAPNTNQPTNESSQNLSPGSPGAQAIDALFTQIDQDITDSDYTALATDVYRLKDTNNTLVYS